MWELHRDIRLCIDLQIPLLLFTLVGQTKIKTASEKYVLNLYMKEKCHYLRFITLTQNNQK